MTYNITAYLPAAPNTYVFFSSYFDISDIELPGAIMEYSHMVLAWAIDGEQCIHPVTRHGVEICGEESRNEWIAILRPDGRFEWHDNTYENAAALILRMRLWEEHFRSGSDNA